MFNLEKTEETFIDKDNVFLYDEGYSLAVLTIKDELIHQLKNRVIGLFTD